MISILQNIILGITLAALVDLVNVEIIKEGLKKSFLPAFTLSIGAALADTTYLLLVYFGLYHFIEIPSIKTLIWIFGSIILIYLSIREFK